MTELAAAPPPPPTRSRTASAGRARPFSLAKMPTVIGSSSSKRTALFPRNTCCCSIISATRSTPSLEAKLGVYLRRIQGAHGGWPLFQDGEFDLSASVMGYFALKMIGDSPDAEHMRRAREAIRAHGGADQSNVFTRFMLALYGVVGWRAVPVMPVEIMLLPRWSPFTLAKISYWSRTSIAPMLVLQALKPRARNVRGVGIDELFLEPPQTLGPPRKSPHQKASWFLLFRAIDEMLRLIEPWLPKRQRRRAIDKAVDFIVARLNGDDGIGAIFPPMAYSLMMFGALGLPRDHPHCVISRAAIDKLLGGQNRRSLLPALRLADLGHRPRLPRAARSRRQGGDRARRARPAMA